jgi:hypothetical protein
MPSLTPCRDLAFVLHRFGYPQAGARGGLGWQHASVEEAAGDDLTVRLGQSILPKIPDQVDRDVVAAGYVAVEEQPAT